MSERLPAALLCIALIAGASGGGGELLPSAIPIFVATIRETASRALERFDDLETAGVAIIVAYKAGYTFDQIVAGVMDGALSADGTIENVEPAQALKYLVGIPVVFGPQRTSRW